MQKLLFSGLLGSNAPEATPKFYPLHHYFYLWGLVEIKNITYKIRGIQQMEFSHKFDRNNIYK